MNDEERRQWVLNDEGVYRWYIGSRMGAVSVHQGEQTRADRDN
jgi:hypothetical protein